MSSGAGRMKQPDNEPFCPKKFVRVFAVAAASQAPRYGTFADLTRFAGPIDAEIEAARARLRRRPCRRLYSAGRVNLEGSASLASWCWAAGAEGLARAVRCGCPTPCFNRGTATVLRQAPLRVLPPAPWIAHHQAMDQPPPGPIDGPPRRRLHRHDHQSLRIVDGSRVGHSDRVESDSIIQTAKPLG